MRVVPTHDDLPTKLYHGWLRQYNRLSDCSWFWCHEHQHRGRFSNLELAQFRNTKAGVIYTEEDGGKFKRVARGKYTLSQTRLSIHREAKAKKSAVWLSNDEQSNVLLLLLDLDRKTPQTDCESAALYITTKYFGGRCYTEQSTSGKGLHVYFFVDITGVDRNAFKDAIDYLGDRLKVDPVLASHSQALDNAPFYGLPTLWRSRGAWEVAYRGNQLKVPYLPAGMSDFTKLSSLVPLSGGDLVRWWRENLVSESALEIVPPTLPPATSPAVSNIRLVQNEKPHSERIKAVSAEDGPSRRASLFRSMMLDNPNTTEDEYVSAYTIRTPENGGEEKVRADYRRMAKRFVIATKGKAIDFSRYVEVVRETVPALAMVTPKRKTKLDHQRVAEFVAVKMHQANQSGEYQGVQGLEVTLSFWRSLVQQEQVKWMLAEDTHARLIKVCTRYKLLEVIEDYTCPSYAGAKNGRARRIGPGEALGEEYTRYAFTRARLQGEAASKEERKQA